MFRTVYRMQMPTGILIFDVEISAQELTEDGEICNPSELKQKLCDWWVDPDSLRRTPEEACVGAWATATDYFVASRQHSRVKCTKVSVVTSGQETLFQPTDDTWSKLDV